MWGWVLGCVRDSLAFWRIYIVLGKVVCVICIMEQYKDH